MRSKLGGHVGGSGTAWAFIEPEETYFDYKAGYVRFPSDNATDEELAKLSGECKTFHIGGENKNDL